MNAAAWTSLSSISLARAAARTGAGRFTVRATSRTCMRLNCQRSVVVSGPGGVRVCSTALGLYPHLIGRRPRLLLRLFRPPPSSCKGDGASQLPAHVVLRVRKNPMPCDTGFDDPEGESIECHRRSGYAGWVKARCQLASRQLAHSTTQSNLLIAVDFSNITDRFPYIGDSDSGIAK